MKNYFCIFSNIFLLLGIFTELSKGNISDDLIGCCKIGKKHATDNQHCKNIIDYDELNTEGRWHRLCTSASSLCCSREIENQQCEAGRLAAKDNVDCDKPPVVEMNHTSSITFINCCKSCQLGLTVAAANHNCSQSFDLFNAGESFSICCNSAADPYDDSFVINEGENFCQVLKRLNKMSCEQICVPTEESFTCSCKPGFKLNEDGITCNAVAVAPAQVPVSASTDVDDLEDEEYGDEEEGKDEDGKCRPGYIEEGEICVDLDECDTGTNKCEDNQYCLNTPGSHDCLNIRRNDCLAGFRFNAKTEKCDDINECLEDSHECRRNQSCLNTRGNYSCHDKPVPECMPGFLYDITTSECQDIDECLENPCHEFSECVNEKGGYHCSTVSEKQCPPGFLAKHNKCIDVDECLLDKNACSFNENCVNEQGGYHCECKMGFKSDSTTNECVDINECQVNNHNCLPTQRCDNTIGSYTCTRIQSCGTGYVWHAEKRICDDNNECELGTHNCPGGYLCQNIIGSFRCHRITTTSTSTTTTTTTTTTTKSPRYLPSYLSRTKDANDPIASRITPLEYSALSFENNSVNSCGRGFRRNYMGACVDFDECENPHTCRRHQRCINTNGSYKCQNLSNCYGSTCEDVDKCKTGEHQCPPGQTCEKRKGVYRCNCPTGLEHSLDRQSCEDIDECKRNNMCAHNSICRNTMGSYSCECKNGYRKRFESDRKCEDVDECLEEGENLCEQKCINYPGTYRCTCNRGFTLGRDNRTCDDENECDSYNMCMGDCINVPGSYRCSCPSGYELQADKKTCRDINECQKGYCKGRYEVCTNTQGSYKCHKIICPYGFINNIDRKNVCTAVNRVCEHNDCMNKITTYSHNFVSLTSKLRVPPEGILLFNLRGPDHFDIEFDLKLIRTTELPNVKKATREHFLLKRKHTSAQLVLMQSLEGLQDIELELSMIVFMNGEPQGKSVAKLFLYVSAFTF